MITILLFIIAIPNILWLLGVLIELIQETIKDQEPIKAAKTQPIEDAPYEYPGYKFDKWIGEYLKDD
jgi:hypothetical protein